MVGDRRGVEFRVDRALAVRGAFIAFMSIFLALTLSGLAAASHSPEYDLLDRFGPDGTEASGFAAAGPVAVDQEDHIIYVIDRDAGKLFKFNESGDPVAFSGSASYISDNEISGLVFFPFAGENQVAVDSNTHEFYVTSDNTVRAFQASGEPADFTAGPWAGTNAIGGFTRLNGVAVDVNGAIYASDREAGVVRIFAPSGEELTSFAVENDDSGEGAANLAVDSTGSVYVNRRVGTVLKFTPSSFPVTSATTYAAAAAPVDPVGSYTVAVDPATDDVYLAQVDNASGARILRYGKDGQLLATFAGPGQDGGDLNSAEGLGIDGASGKVYVAVRPNGDLSQVRVFKEVVVPPGAPTVEHLTVSELTGTSATLHALINPNSTATSYRFEYGIGDCSVNVCTVVPLGGASVGEGHDGVWVSQEISGLIPGTVYQYRVVAENEFGADEAHGVFQAQGTNLEFKLSDSRVWEMVSPPNKRGAVLLGPRKGHIQASVDGNGLTYISASSIEVAPEGNRAEVASVLARRGTDGWDSEDISPANARVVQVPVGFQGEFKLFSPDLSRAILDPRDGTSLSPEASERTPYLRENTKPPVYRPMVTGKEGFANVPAGTKFGGEGAVSAALIQSATTDLSHVVLVSTVPLVTAASRPSPTLYVWTGGQIEAVSMLPEAEGGGLVAASFVGSGPASLRNAISSDGSRVFWTGVNPNNHLYLRDMENAESVRIDVPQAGASEAGEVEPVFQGASTDGSVVFFTDSQQLTADASPAGHDLYRCEIIEVAAGCDSLVNLTGATAGSGESADVQGVVSALTDDGSMLYFVARGALESEANLYGQAAVPGEPNLYLWQEGDGLRFIATLADGDRADWGLPGDVSPPGMASGLSAAASPSGRYFSFMSERELTDPDDPDALNIDVKTGDAVEQVFRYDAVADRLDCVSCAPSGAAPESAVVTEANELVDPRRQWQGRSVAALLPQPVTINEGGPNLTIYRPRAVLDNGRVFFNSIDALVPADSNADWDVYQYEDVGIGDCGVIPSNTAIARAAGGCTSLMSSGAAETESGFLDSSISGNDVFFLTSARLAPTDVDDEQDVYDARVGGTPATTPMSGGCIGDPCRPGVAQRAFSTPGSMSVSGSGNVKSRKKCPKGKRKVKRGGKQRCIHRKAKKRTRRSGQPKGAGR